MFTLFTIIMQLLVESRRNLTLNGIFIYSYLTMQVYHAVLDGTEDGTWKFLKMKRFKILFSLFLPAVLRVESQNHTCCSEITL